MKSIIEIAQENCKGIPAQQILPDHDRTGKSAGQPVKENRRSFFTNQKHRRNA
jgi:hypothetical protein